MERQGPNCNFKEIEGRSCDSRILETKWTGDHELLLHRTRASSFLLFELVFNMQPSPFPKLRIEINQKVIKVVQMKDNVLDTVVFMDLVIQHNAGMENALCKYLLERNNE